MRLNFHLFLKATTGDTRARKPHFQHVEQMKKKGKKDQEEKKEKKRKDYPVLTTQFHTECKHKKKFKKIFS